MYLRKLGCPLLGTLLSVEIVLGCHLLELLLGCQLLLLLRSCQFVLLAIELVEHFMQLLLPGCLTMFEFGCPLLGTLLLVHMVLAGHLLELLLGCQLLLLLSSCQFFLLALVLIEQFMQLLLAGGLTVFTLGCLLLFLVIVLAGHLLELLLGCQLFLLLSSCQYMLFMCVLVEHFMQLLLAGCLTVFALGCPLLGTLFLVHVVLAGLLMTLLGLGSTLCLPGFLAFESLLMSFECGSMLLSKLRQPFLVPLDCFLATLVGSSN